MEWDPDEADKRDIIDRRGAGGGRSAGGLGGLGSILGGILGGGRSGGGFPGGVGGTAGGGARRPGKAGAGLLGLVVMGVLALLGSGVLGGGGGTSGGGGFDLGSIIGGGEFPSIGSDTAGLGDPGDPADLAIPAEEDPDRETVEFSNVVLTDANDVWTELFDAAEENYQRTKLVLFSGGVDTGGCGSASSQMGPFYCPADNLVYIDLSFFDELATNYGAAGDFAQAYVLAHEVGHHVQNELGISSEVRRLESENPGASKGSKGLSVRQELQADCFAGVWAHARYEEGKLESGDIAEALSAAEGVGDDRLQSQAGGRVNPDLFSHGTSAQRQKWFEVGFDSGDPDRCDTFSVSEL